MDLFQIQAYVAGEIGARAAMRITDAECNRLADILDNLERAAAAGHYEEAEDYDYDFHRRVNASGAAPKFVWLLNTVVPYARHVFRGTGDDTEMFDSAGRRAILTASANRDPEEARRAYSQQLLVSREIMEAHFKAVEAGVGDLDPAGRPDQPA